MENSSSSLVALLGAAAVLCVAAGGCITVESLDAVARRHPFNPRVTLSRDDRMIPALPREKLIGRWRGSWVDAEAVWCGDGSYKFFTPTTFTETYDFRADGSVSWQTSSNGMQGAPVSTTWTYADGKLTLNNIKRPYYTVFWFDENEIVIADRSAQTANGFYMRYFKETYGSEYSHRVKYDRDRFLNVHQIHHHVSPAKGERRDHVVTPRRLSRISGEFNHAGPHQGDALQSRVKAAGGKKVRHRDKSLYDVMYIERKMDDDFSYRFELKLAEDVDWSLKTIKAVKSDFRKNIKDDYSESFTGSSVASLFVEFPAFSFCDGKIAGRAVVMNMVVKSMSYDPLARTGHLSVLVNANQFEETRRWIRRNIETLARDKNIALVTGEVPPAARFYLGREELKGGNVLEIEFRTE